MICHTRCVIAHDNQRQTIDNLLLFKGKKNGLQIADAAENQQIRGPKMNLRRSLCLSAFLIGTGGLLAGCGGGSSGSGDDTTTISGTVYASAVSGARVTVRTTAGDTIAGPVTSGDDGSYTIEVPNDRLSGPLVIEAQGGTYTDEATGLEVSDAGSLTAYVMGKELSTKPKVGLTPGSTILEMLVTEHGKTLQEAEETFETAFGYTPDSTILPAATGEEPQQRAVLRAGAFSQLNMDLGLRAADQFELLKAIARDLSDGTADGSDSGGPVDIGSTGKRLPADPQNRFARALAGFFSSTNNPTGLTADKIGSIPQGNVVLTDSYRIERTSVMEPTEGKSTCTLAITNKTDGTPATGLAISLMPMMNMAMHKHSTPVDGCVEQTDPAGTYRCTVYYLMASKMMNGMSMGFWDMKVMIGGMDGEEAHFYPDVKMAMGGDTVKAVLLGQNDRIAGMGGTSENRKYFLFNDGITGTTGNHTFNLFIATKENMMSYPAVSVGTVLKDENGNDWTVDSMSVEVSTDRTNWIAATDNGGGHWSAAGITGLTDGSRGTLYVRLTVNDEQKTDDGNAPDGVADNAVFEVTPGGSSMSMGM